MDAKAEIAAIVEESFEDERHFLVDLKISAGKGPKKVLVLVDGDDGITIDDCAALSRKIGHRLEEDDVMEGRYTLEVSSPGVDFPLTQARQFQKNVGRVLKILITGQAEIRGELLDVSTQGITLKKEIKKGKKREYEQVELSFAEITRAIVQVSFK